MRYHPLWTHTPAIAMIGYMVYRLCNGQTAHHLANMPKGAGSTSAYGPIIGVLLMAVFYLAMSVFFDESWAKNEQPKKSFNWMSLFDEITIALLLASVLWQGSRYSASQLSWIAVGCAVLAGCVAEWLRPYRAEALADQQMTDTFAVKPGSNWLFYQNQNPPYVNGLVIVVSIMMLSQGISAAYRGDVAFGMLSVIIIALMLSIWNGLRVSVSPSKIRVSLGIFNWKLLDISPDQITNAEVLHFNPLRDFGGWGIRISRSKKGYYFEGTQGVLITPAKGMPVLIGSNQPIQLLQAVLAAMGRTAEL